MHQLGRRQAVRHGVLISACAGSNPAGPAIPSQLFSVEVCCYKTCQLTSKLGDSSWLN